MKTEKINELITLAQQGDERAFGELFKEFKQTVFLYALRWVHDEDDAKDIVQLTFIAVWKGLGKYNGLLSSFATWIRSVARMKCITLYRYRYGYGKCPRLYVRCSDSEGLLGYDDSPEISVIRGEESAILEERVQTVLNYADKLAPAQKKVFRLRYLGGMSMADIQQITGRTVAQIYSNLTDARESIRRMVEKKEGTLSGCGIVLSDSTPENRRLILHYVKQLPVDQQLVFRLRYVEGLGMDDVKKMTGKTVPQIASNSSKARKNIRKYSMLNN